MPPHPVKQLSVENKTSVAKQAIDEMANKPQLNTTTTGYF